jgi:CRP/FNR family cyclic AMP-dependent transcriptional regulator
MECEIFSGITKAYLESLLNKDAICSLDQNEYLFYEGDPGTGMFIVLDGTLDVTLEQDDINYVIASVKRGSFLGEISMLIDQKRTATVKAKEPSHLFHLETQRFKQQINVNDLNALRISYNISKVLAKRLKKADEIIRSLQLKSKSTSIQKEIALFRDLLHSEL